MSKRQAAQESPVLKQLTSALEAFKKEAGAREAALKDLKIESVKEVSDNGVSCAIVTVPYKQINLFRAIHEEIVKRFEDAYGNHVVVVGKRRAFPKRPEPGRRYRQIRPHSRTLRDVQQKVLEDVTFPVAIVGKRTHYDLRGKQVTRVILDSQSKAAFEERVPAMNAAYHRLTGLQTVFQFEE